MRLKKARVQKYRSIRDTGWFDVEELKTILVGPNESGKTVLLRALQQINRPEGVRGFKALRDYPRSEYNDITTKKVDPKQVTIVEAKFRLDAEEIDIVGEEFMDATYVVGRKLDDTFWHRFDGGPKDVTYLDIAEDLSTLAEYADSLTQTTLPQNTVAETFKSKLTGITKDWVGSDIIDGDRSDQLQKWIYPIELTNEWDSDHEELLGQMVDDIDFSSRKKRALDRVKERIPVFVLFNNYFRVRPRIHLDHLAQRLESGTLEDESYDYGNNCLLRLLGFTARELSSMGSAPEPQSGNSEMLERYQDQLDNRSYQLNAASVRLTKEIQQGWVPEANSAEADQLRIDVDQQYLKVVVVDDLGVEVELDQRSAGFRWLVSFFVVFFAETKGKHKNAILLLDEPGLSLHGLKQREFRNTISRLAEYNQTLYTTHSPFLVGPDELDLVRVVEMTDRGTGTQVHTKVLASDPGALLPLQEALGYDLAQSLFGQKRNLVLEGLTDYWYIENVAQLLRDAGIVSLNEKIVLVPASSAGKVVYFATILYSNHLKVAALLDSDSAGDQAAQQDTLVHTLGYKAILRTKDAYDGQAKNPEIEDLLRDTLVQVAKSDLGWDVEAKAASQPDRGILAVFSDEISGFSKYKLAKAFLRWARAHEADDLTEAECRWWTKLIKLINVALR